MKIIYKTLVLGGLFGLMGNAIADDASTQKSQHSQQMKDCMAKQKAANAGMTQEAMKTVCKNEAKGSQTKDGNDLATAPQSPQK
jgi:hypothetical protein